MQAWMVSVVTCLEEITAQDNFLMVWCQEQIAVVLGCFFRRSRVRAEEAVRAEIHHRFCGISCSGPCSLLVPADIPCFRHAARVLVVEVACGIQQDTCLEGQGSALGRAAEIASSMRYREQFGGLIRFLYDEVDGFRKGI